MLEKGQAADFHLFHATDYLPLCIVAGVDVRAGNCSVMESVMNRLSDTTGCQIASSHSIHHSKNFPQLLRPDPPRLKYENRCPLSLFPELKTLIGSLLSPRCLNYTLSHVLSELPSMPRPSLSQRCALLIK